MIGAKPMDLPEFNRRAAKYLRLIADDDSFNGPEAHILRLRRLLDAGLGIAEGDQRAVFAIIVRYKSLVWDKDSVRFAEDHLR